MSYHNFRRDSFLAALGLAIRRQSEYEQHELKLTHDSTLVAGWRLLYEAVRRDNQATIVLLEDALT